MAAIFFIPFALALALAFVLGYFQFLAALYIKDRAARSLLLLLLPGLTILAGVAFFYRFLHLPPSFLGPFLSEEFFCFLISAVTLLGILAGGAIGSHARRNR